MAALSFVQRAMRDLTTDGVCRASLRLPFVKGMVLGIRYAREWGVL
jgi:hypothetical protein